ncbi:MAG TPA: PGPGW domain-containing protein [Steroidobacteraceae bacterium]|nr:PGPGW domain-containing protein [Steroidobacteraceae bacterium]
MAADDPTPPAGKTNRSPAMRFWRRLGIAIGGGLLILAGAILSLPLVPGPGFALILAGLGVLSLEFERPRIWLAALKRRFKELTQRIRGKSSSGDAS